MDRTQATGAERAEVLPGDELLRADVVMDRGFDLPAPPETVWPWLVQLGKRRAGWYLPATVERLVPTSRRALRHLEPRLLEHEVGDVIADWGGADTTFTLAAIDPPRTLLYTSRRGSTDLTWCLHLTPILGAGGTRVHLRLRLGPVRHRRLAASLGGAVDALTIMGLAAGLRERVGRSVTPVSHPGASIEIRPAGHADADAVLHVIRDAFGAESPGHGDQVADLWAEVRGGDHLLAELVAVDGGEVVGHVGVSHCWLDARPELVDVAVLSPLSTRPARQEGGIGTALVAAAIEAARATGRPALFLEGSPAFYGARGFTRASSYGLEPASRRTPEAAFQVVTFDAYADWMTGRLVYPDVWWRHDAAGLRDPDLAFLEDLLAREFPVR